MDSYAEGLLKRLRTAGSRIHGSEPRAEGHLAVAAADRGYACVYRATGGQLSSTCSARGDVLSARERLEQYLEEVRQRLRATVVRASGCGRRAHGAVGHAQRGRRSSVSPASLLLQSWTARIVLVVALLVAAAAMLWRPLVALQPKRRAKSFERHLPAQGGRIETYMELVRRRERGEPVPLIDLLAEDALAVADQAPPQTAVPSKRSGYRPRWPASPCSCSLRS